MKDSCIAWGTVRDAADTRMPTPRVPHMNTAESPYSSARLPRIGTSKTKCATTRAIVIWPYATRRFGMILPSSSSQRRIGLTTSASSVPPFALADDRDGHDADGRLHQEGADQPGHDEDGGHEVGVVPGAHADVEGRRILPD